MVRGSSQPTNQSQTQPQSTPQTTQNNGVSTTPSGGSGDLVQALIAKGYNPTDAQNAANGPRAEELRREYLGGGSSGGVPTVTPAPTINLPQLYDSLYSSSGIVDLEKGLSEQTRQYTEAKAKINDNPFLSEATRVGRIAKIESLFNERTANTRNDIATRKADIETKLNLQTKQFDIQSQQAQIALDQFNSLLGSGALDNASNEDIASITRSTGLNSGIIKSAIEAKKIKDLSTEIKSFDDGNEEGFVIYTIDPRGNIVSQSKQVTGKSAKKTTSYSADPGVSSFIQQYLTGGTDISSLW